MPHSDVSNLSSTNNWEFSSKCSEQPPHKQHLTSITLGHSHTHTETTPN